MALGPTEKPPWQTPEPVAAKEIINIDPNPTPEREADKDFSDLDRSRRKLSNKQYEQNIRERKRYGLYAYRITRTWVGALIFFVFAQMFLKLFNAGLAPEEFITLVTTTTASVFGFWWLVGKYLFGSDNN